MQTEVEWTVVVSKLTVISETFLCFFSSLRSELLNK